MRTEIRGDNVVCVLAKLIFSTMFHDTRVEDVTMQFSLYRHSRNCSEQLDDSIYSADMSSVCSASYHCCFQSLQLENLCRLHVCEKWCFSGRNSVEDLNMRIVCRELCSRYVYYLFNLHSSDSFLSIKAFVELIESILPERTVCSIKLELLNHILTNQTVKAFLLKY